MITTSVKRVLSNNDENSDSIRNMTCSGVNHAESGDPKVNSQTSSLPLELLKALISCSGIFEQTGTNMQLTNSVCMYVCMLESYIRGAD